jgi:hypothetical protein
MIAMPGKIVLGPLSRRLRGGQAAGDPFVEYSDPTFVFILQARDEFLYKSIVDCLGVPVRKFVSPLVDAGK